MSPGGSQPVSMCDDSSPNDGRVGLCLGTPPPPPRTMRETCVDPDPSVWAPRRPPPTWGPAPTWLGSADTSRCDPPSPPGQASGRCRWGLHIRRPGAQDRGAVRLLSCAGKSMAELNIDFNLKYEYSKILEGPDCPQPVLCPPPSPKTPTKPSSQGRYGSDRRCAAARAA